MNDLEQRVRALEERLSHFEKSDRYTIQKDIQLFDGRDIQLGKSRGTMIGTAGRTGGTSNSQKLGFFGKTPAVQQAAITAPNAQGAIYNQTDAETLRTAINSIRTVLQTLGLTL